MTLKVNNFNLLENNDDIPQKDLLKSLAFFVLDFEKVNTSVNLIFCNNTFIKNLNHSFRGFNKPTDVLSFPYHEKDLWGEIYISIETAQTQAKDFKCNLFKELQKLIIHGCLHLTGWDHQTDAEEKAMKKREIFFLEKNSKNF